MSDAEPEGGREPRAMSFLAAAAWTITLVLGMGVAVQLTESARPGAVGDLVNDTACQLLAYSLVLFAMVRVYAPSTPMRVALGVRAASPLHVILAGIAGAALAPGLSVADDLLAKRFPQTSEEIEALTKLLTAPTLGARVALVLALVVAIPIAEELFFRGILFGGLGRGRTVGVAVLGSAMYYATAQLNPRAFVTTAVVGIVLAWLRAQSGSIASSIAAHVAFQAVQVAPLVRTGDPSIDVVYPRTWMLGGLLVGVVALLAARALASRDPRAMAARDEISPRS